MERSSGDWQASASVAASDLEVSHKQETEPRMSSPKISVVMSVFNGQTFLSEAIESILGQTFRDFEFLIIDDGSTDRTAEILSTIAQSDGRIQIVSRSNKGRAISLNVGINLAAGKYIGRMDADDVALPRRLAQ